MRGGGGGEFIKTLDANSMSSLSVYLLKLRRIPAKNFEINETYFPIKWQSKLKFCYLRLFPWKFRAHCPKEIKISLDVQIKPFFAVQSFLPLHRGDFDHSDQNLRYQHWLEGCGRTRPHNIHKIIPLKVKPKHWQDLETKPLSVLSVNISKK